MRPLADPQDPKPRLHLLGALALVLLATSCSMPTELPRAVARQMKPDTLFDSVWMASDFQPQEGYVLDIVWLEKTRPWIREYFDQRVASLHRPESPYRLTLYVSIDDSAFTFGGSGPRIRCEGKVEGGDREVLAAFLDDRLLGFGTRSNVKAGIDALLARITRGLQKQAGGPPLPLEPKG